LTKFRVFACNDHRREDSVDPDRALSDLIITGANHPYCSAEGCHKRAVCTMWIEV
jgi:hypothetical protein